MARKPRVHTSGYTQHVTQRGNNREACFFAAQDYQFYLQTLKKAADLEAVQVHAYVLMTNHLHLLLTPERDRGIAEVMKRVSQLYTQYVNRKYQWTGSIWEGRYKSSVIDAEQYLLSCYRYIEMNPVRAGLASKPSEYYWSSARWHGFGKSSELITDHSLYLALGRTAEMRQCQYRKLFRNALGDELVYELRKIFSLERVLGDSRFEEKVISSRGN